MYDIILDRVYRRRFAALSLAACGLVFPFLLAMFSGMGLTVLVTDSMSGALRARSALPVSIRAQAAVSWLFAVVVFPFLLIGASVPILLLWNWWLDIFPLKAIDWSQLPAIVFGILGLTSLYWLIPLMLAEAQARGWHWATLLISACFGILGIAPGAYVYGRASGMIEHGSGLEWLSFPIIVAGYWARTRVYLSIFRWAELFSMNAPKARGSHISWWNSMYSPFQMMASILWLSPLAYALQLLLQSTSYSALALHYIQLTYLVLYLTSATMCVACVGDGIRALRTLPIRGNALALGIWATGWALVLAAAFITFLLTPGSSGLMAAAGAILFGGILIWYLPVAFRNGAALSPLALMCVFIPLYTIGNTLIDGGGLRVPLYIFAIIQLAFAPLCLMWLKEDLSKNSNTFLPGRVPYPYAPRR